MDVALEAEVGGGGGEGHAVLAGAGFGDELLLAEVDGEEAFAHAVVELVGAGVVEVFALHVDLRGAELLGEAFGVVDGRGAALEVLADGAQLGDELGGARDGVVGVADLVHDGFERGRDVGAAVLAETAGLVGVQIEVVGIIGHVHGVSWMGVGDVSLRRYMDAGKTSSAEGRGEEEVQRAHAAYAG